MVEAVSRLVAIPSVLETDDRTPFGPQVDRCLDEALAILSELGLHTYKSPDGMFGYAEIGEGELFGVLCHLDVVQRVRRMVGIIRLLCLRYRIIVCMAAAHRMIKGPL